MTPYLQMLREGYAACRCDGDISKLEYLSEYVFNFTTYDSEQAEFFAARAVEVCAAISDRTTFEYIENPERYRWFLVMVNMRFFSPRLNWGTSVRGAWWDYDEPTKFSSCGMCIDGEYTTGFEMTRDEWLAFIEAVRSFAAEVQP